MNHRVKLLAICAVFVIPLVAAAIAFFLLPPAKSMNYGELVKPVIALPEVPVPLVFPGNNGDGKQVNIDRGLRGKWLMVMQDSSACAERCQKKLYAMPAPSLAVNKTAPCVWSCLLMMANPARSYRLHIKEPSG
jgi:hypothetical protein